ncbi:MAG: beta-lactamase family protein [Lewinellaceae bacterium]|nr:beta-lactamase family protein [Lewinellaceae bacterium]
MKKKFLVLMFFFLGNYLIHAQTPPARAIIDEYLNTLPEKAEIAIGIIQPDTVYRQGYLIRGGKAAPVNNTRQVFEIGSITKTFTGALVMDQVRKGNMELNGPIAACFPERDKISSEKAKQVTVKQLLTHTSGLSNGPASFILPYFRARLFSPGNPHKYFRWKQYRRYLRNEKLDYTPGEKWAYNNCGFALLGYLAAQQEGVSWEELACRRLFTPLGMSHTYPTGQGAPRALIVPGYNAKGKPASLWDMDFINPAGSVKSCLDDMLLWAKAHLQAPEGSLFDDMKKWYEVPTGWDDNFMGNAWVHHITDSGHIIWHGGATGGYRAFIAFNDTQKTGVVILTNFSSHHPNMRDEDGKSLIRRYGFHLLESLSIQTTGQNQLAGQ